jgi:large subunit ribosomal protein L32e
MTEKPAVTPEKALRMRKRAKNKKPEFKRPESWRYVRLKENWRRPRGLDNKMRRKIKGWPPTVSAGYRGPKAARGFHPSGYREVLVYNTEDIRKIDPKTQAVRIAHTVGKRKRANIIAEARKKKITILNVKQVREKAEEEKELPEEESKKEEEVKEEVAEAEKPKRKREKAKKTKGETGNNV